ncbi:MAG TPA: prolipoprotein diacylglyceryl transferase [Polyangia bacterium]|jgi:phosphatidylglycerol:prolipoprotein diacylglycerol transferase|nr:prolipoprotein diacylglyceryl transferase [Polyangia bacterium]
MASHPIHDFSAALFHVREAFVFRWHGFAYLATFVIAYVWLRRTAARGGVALPPEGVSGFVLFGALFGVLAGGRLGCVLLYGWEIVSRDWTEVLKADITDASFAGGIAGVAIFTAYYVRTRRISFLNLADALALIAPPGIFLGRVADFLAMPPEAFGRVTTSRFGMLFPTEVHLGSFRTAHDPMGIADALPHTAAEIMDVARANPPIMEQLLAILQPRHAWALYEALLNGVVLFLVLVLVRLRFRDLPDGVLAGLFLLLCGAFSFGLGYFREPMAGHGLMGGLTMEQWVCLPISAAGAGVLLWSHARGRRARSQSSEG